MKKNIVTVTVVLMVILGLFVMTAYAKDLPTEPADNHSTHSTKYMEPKQVNMSDVWDLINKEGQLIGLTVSEKADHVKLIEVCGWTLVIRGETIVWGTADTGGKFIPSKNIVRFEDYDWDISGYLNAEDDINEEVKYLFYTEWYELYERDHE